MAYVWGLLTVAAILAMVLVIISEDDDLDGAA